MDLAHVLDGLDAHPWASVSHAYGPAGNLPALLRAFAGEDDAAAGKALGELYASILHQGSVYPASAAAAPFLARIAAAGRRSGEALSLLGGLAESQGERGAERGSVRAAVAAQLPLLLPLLDDTDAGVRRAAAWTVSHTREASVLPELRRRWGVEDDLLVRAELLSGLARLDAQAVGAEAQALLDADTPAPLRLAAAFAWLDAGLPWGAEQHTAVLSLLPAGDLSHDGFDQDRTEPLSDLVEALLRRETAADRDAACALMEAALRDERPEVREEGVWAADQACYLSRGVAGRLVPALVPAADHWVAVALFGKLGPAAAEAAPVLVAVVQRVEDDESLDRALTALVHVAPRLAAPLLARALGRCPRALLAVAGAQAFPFDQELLDAARDRLSTAGQESNEAFQLARLLRQWGPAAVPALPELSAALDRCTSAAPALAAIAAEAPPVSREHAAAALREAAEAGSVDAAKALYDLTGDSAPVLGVLATALTANYYESREATRTAGELGAVAAELAPALRTNLGSSDLDVVLFTVDALWRITGDADEVVPVLNGVFARQPERSWPRWNTWRAIDTATLLGPAARPLTPHLEAALTGSPELAPSAALARTHV